MKYIFGNWKMYLDYAESNKLADQLKDLEIPKELCVGVFPSFLAVADVVKLLEGSGIVVGAQDAGYPSKGAYTSLISAQMLKAVGCTHTLLGHSERRYIFGDTNDVVRKKIEASLESGLVPVVCVGETREDLEDNKTEYRIKKQLVRAFDGLDLDGHEVIIAYEPVWAISKGGKGEPCSSEQAVHTHNFIRDEIRAYTNKQVPILYGGSVDESNVLSYVSKKEIDGVLIGSASTKINSFTSIITTICHKN